MHQSIPETESDRNDRTCTALDPDVISYIDDVITIKKWVYLNSHGKVHPSPRR